MSRYIIEARGLGYTPPPPRGLLERLLRGPGVVQTAPTVIDADLRLVQGERLGLIGPSGSGKSTFARLLAGFLAPSRGTLYWQGCDVASLSPRARRRAAITHVQLVHQDPYAVLNPALTACEVVAESARARERLRGRAMIERAEEALEQVGLVGLGGRSVMHLSGGERRRVTLACALCAPPRLLIVDEPTVGLDPIARDEIVELLDALAERHRVALLVITHDLGVVRSLCRQIRVMDQGRLGDALLTDIGCSAPVRAQGGMTRRSHRQGSRGNVTLEYLTFVAAGTLFVGLLFWLFGGTLRTWFDFAQWWWSNPVF